MDIPIQLSAVVVGAFLLMSVVGGQSGGSMDVCDLCNVEDLPNCNITNSYSNSRVHCELSDKICILLIVDPTSDDMHEATMNGDNYQKICLFKKMDVSTTTLFVSTSTEPYSSSEIGSTGLETSETMSSINEPTDAYELSSSNIETQSVEPSTTTTDSLDYQNDVSPDMPSYKSVADPRDLIETISCLACSTLKDASCLDEVDKVKTIRCPTESGCMSLYTDNHLVRNCSSSFQSEVIAACQKPGNTTCEHCLDENCNKMPWKRCYSCNSHDDRDCALWSKSDNIPSSICPSHNDHCLVRIAPSGHTERECVASNYKGKPNELYSTCDSSLCNSGVYPADRLRCAQCTDCPLPVRDQPCVLYIPLEECFMYMGPNSKIVRGCVSNTSEMMQCRMNAPKCVTCNAGNACNNVAIMRDPTLSCIKCNSLTDPSCAWAQPDTATAKCHNKVLYYLHETCMTEYDPVTKNAVRDCSFDHGACLMDDRNCSMCAGDGCNRGNLRFQECIQCDSEMPESKTCKEAAEGIRSTKCLKEVQTFDTKGCFSMTKGSITTRGCVVDLSDEDLKVCREGMKNQCELCEEDGCNNKLAPSAAWKIGQTYLLFLPGIVLGAIQIVPTFI